MSTRVPSCTECVSLAVLGASDVSLVDKDRYLRSVE